MSKEIVYRKLSELKKLPNNPRTIKKEDMERLKESVKNNQDYFEARPLILSDRTGELVIIAGNQRYEAAKALGMEEVPTFLLSGLTEEREKEIIIRDNVSNGEWDMDALANEWDAELLQSWGVDGVKFEDYDEMLEVASAGSIEEYSEDTDYDLRNLYREKVSSKITADIDKAVRAGEVRPEIEEILRDRATQCSVFNFDEIIKFYRSGDASESEKDLLRRLYLVFVTSKEALMGGLEELDRATGRIIDEKLMEQTDEEG